MINPVLNAAVLAELTGLYGSELLEDFNEIIKLYEFYEGKGQEWCVPPLDYQPTKKRANYVRKLIKEQARYLFGKTPYFKIETLKEEVDPETQSKPMQNELEEYLGEVLRANKFSSKIIKAARDCFIGKRVAIKINVVDEQIKVNFKPSLEFIHETDIEDTDKLKKIIFFYQINNELKKEEQRIWKQTYHMNDEGKCILNEAIYDGYGNVYEELFTDEDTGLDFIPAMVIINDGLTGDILGETDISEDMMENQNVYNRLTSDDIDALRFNMFPQTVATDAQGESLSKIKIAPAALIDLATDPSTPEGLQAKLDKLETRFSYNERFENSINRVKSDMFEMLNIPNISINELKGLITSGKSLKAVYWPLTVRSEEKYQEWEPALAWMADTIIKITKIYKLRPLPEVEYKIDVDNIFPLSEDEYEERANDRDEVQAQVRSRASYIEKWGITTQTSEDELMRIARETQLLENSYIYNDDAPPEPEGLETNEDPPPLENQEEGEEIVE